MLHKQSTTFSIVFFFAKALTQVLFRNSILYYIFNLTRFNFICKKKNYSFYIKMNSNAYVISCIKFQFEQLLLVHSCYNLIDHITINDLIYLKK